MNSLATGLAKDALPGLSNPFAEIRSNFTNFCGKCRRVPTFTVISQARSMPRSWIRDGADDNLCVDLATLAFFKTQAMTRSIPPQPVCGEGHVAASHAFEDQHLYDSLIDAFLMRAFVPSAGVSGHDHFFNSFAKFFVVDPRHTGAWLDEVSARAAAQNEQYLELMDTPPFAPHNSDCE